MGNNVGISEAYKVRWIILRFVDLKEYWMLQQNDKKTGRPKVWIYRDKATGVPKGEATITYEDEQAASSAIEWFNSKQAIYWQTVVFYCNNAM